MEAKAKSLNARAAFAAGAILVLSALAAAAQQAPPTPAEKPSAPPAEAAPRSEGVPAPEPRKRRAAPPSETPAGHEMLGLSVFSSDGGKVGDVRAVNLAPDGRVAALHVRTGGFLGFGARIVAIPEGKFARSGQDVRLTFTADEVRSLPQVKDGR